MDRLTNYEYIVPSVSEEWFKTHRFAYIESYHCDIENYYVLRFPVYKYKSTTMLCCELTVVEGNKDVEINVYLNNTCNTYHPFYHIEYGDYNDLLKKIDNNIAKEFKKLGITRKDKCKRK